MHDLMCVKGMLFLLYTVEPPITDEDGLSTADDRSVTDCI